MIEAIRFGIIVELESIAKGQKIQFVRGLARSPLSTLLLLLFMFLLCDTVLFFFFLNFAETAYDLIAGPEVTISVKYFITV